MKKKLAKVLSVMVAVVISVSAMVVNASAYSWSVSRQHSSSKPGAPTVTKAPQVFIFYPTSVDVTSYSTKCTNYSSETASNGDLAYAKSYAQRREKGSSKIDKISGDQLYRNVYKEYVTIRLTKNVEYGNTLYVRYELVNPKLVLCSISGLVSVSNTTLIGSRYE